MQEHPISGLMKTAMENIREMVDVNTIVGDPVHTQDGSVIIPISKVSFGFASGGGEYGNHGALDQKKNKEVENEDGSVIKFPFAGGSGAGITISPVAFMVCGTNGIKLLPVSFNSPLEKVIEMVPEFMQKAKEFMQKEEPKGDKKAFDEVKSEILKP